MSRLGAIHIAARLVEQRQSALWVAEFVNGHRVFAFLCPELKRNPEEFRVGEWVKVEVSPFDLTEGSILCKLKQAITNES